MNLTQAFKIALKSIAAKKARSALTMLGVIIGLAAVIILVSYAQGQNQQMRAYYESLGSNVININASSWDSKGISDKLYDYCLELDEYVLGVTPVVQMYNHTTIKYGAKTVDNYNSSWEESPQVVMGNQQFSLCNNFTLANGRDISYLDVENYNQVCILGSKMAELLFNYIDPVGKTLTINSVPFEVIGVYESKDPNNMTGMDRYIVLPYTMNRVLNGRTQMDTFVAKAKDAQSTTKAITLLNGFLQGLIGKDNGYYSVTTPNQWQEQGDEQIKLQQRFLGGIAAISLAVGGIGIMNIMLVTVTERTREIGIRKAIGAERKSIIAQFLIEACMICGIGGLFGIAVGYIGTLIVGKASFNLILLPSPGITVGAFFISVALGIGFGLYPAIKASGLQPVEALRAE